MPTNTSRDTPTTSEFENCIIRLKAELDKLYTLQQHEYFGGVSHGLNVLRKDLDGVLLRIRRTVR